MKPRRMEGLPLSSALDGSAPLAGLMQRVQQSQARLDAARALLPAGMVADVRAGPLDDAGWCLLAANPAVAAKLRQLLPAVQTTLVAAGWADVPIKIKVLPRS